MNGIYRNTRTRNIVQKSEWNQLNFVFFRSISLSLSLSVYMSVFDVIAVVSYVTLQEYFAVIIVSHPSRIPLCPCVVYVCASYASVHLLWSACILCKTNHFRNSRKCNENANLMTKLFRICWLKLMNKKK